MFLVRLFLITGGIFNLLMGAVFFNQALLSGFLRLAVRLENTLFSAPAVISIPEDPIHLLLIHGFGAAAMILGATLIYSSSDPAAFLAFIFFDGIGRLLFGSLMFWYVYLFHLMKVILLFGVVELSFALLYLWISVQLRNSS